MLEVSELSFSYNRRQLLSNLSFRVEPGSGMVVVGPNGSGKSTLLSLLSGALKPQHGTIRLQGRVGLVPQRNGIFEDLTVSENLRFFCNLARCPMPDPLPYGLGPYAGKKASALSGGFQKRLSIACTQVSHPDLWLFDEPCAGLDILWREELIHVIEHLKRQGCGILYAGHDPSEFVSFYDSILVLDGGSGKLFLKQHIPAGTEAELIRQQLLLIGGDQ